MPKVTALHAALLGLLFLALTVRAFQARKASGIVLGTGGDRLLERAVRVHANFAEFVPIFLVLLLVAELCGWPAWLLHGLGFAMLGGRVAHAAGLAREPDVMPLRALGMALTMLAILGAALLGLVSAVA